MAEAIHSSNSSSRASTPNHTQFVEEKEDHSQPKDMETVNNMEAEGTVNNGKQVDSMPNVEGATPLESAVDRLLQKQRNELMYELRRIQHGDRPVTGQGNKEAVEQFFQRAIHGESTTVDNTENRPENVVVEVNALVERRPVSNVLQSGGFRRRLENAIRGAFDNIASRAPPRSFTSQRTQPPVSVPPPPSVSNGNNPVVQNTDARAQPEVRERDTNNQEPVSNAAAGQIRRENTPRPTNTPVRDETNSVQLPQERTPPTSNAQAWLQQHIQAPLPGQQVNAWDIIGEAHREGLVMDIGELVQRQLVTGTLQGNFRNVLEHRMLERLQQSGTNGQRVQQFVQSIPRTTHHVRNDFSDLGIMGPGQEEQQSISDHLDEMSVISATAAVSVPYAQSNVAMAREIQSLKQQMKEMMNMMKLSFDLTMDLQRSVRQEVSAAMNQNGATATEARLTSRPVNDTQCLICLDKPVDTVLYQCGHMCICHGCGMNLRQRGSNCPVCRAPIRDIIRAYKCNSE